MPNLIRTMRCFHILSTIIIWPSSHHRYKLNLGILLFLHVSVCEICLDSGVLKHDVVEFVDNQVNCPVAAKSVVEGLFLFLFISWVFFYRALGL